MANKEKIDYLLLDIRELETLIAGIRDAEIYPASFFGQTFNLTHKILKDLHSLETSQIEMLRKQMEEHQALLQSIPNQVAAPMPETPVKDVQIQETRQIVEVKPEILEEEIAELVQEQVQAEDTLQVQPEPEIKTPEAEVEAIAKETIQVQAQEPVQEPVHKGNAERSGLFLNDLLEKNNLSDFRKAFSLNDRFRFRRELFGGDEERMNKVISDLNDLHTYEDSVTYLNNELKWNIEDEAVSDFIKLLEKRFL